MPFQCTEPFIITHLLARYDLNNIENQKSSSFDPFILFIWSVLHREGPRGWMWWTDMGYIKLALFVSSHEMSGFFFLWKLNTHKKKQKNFRIPPGTVLNYFVRGLYTLDNLFSFFFSLHFTRETSFVTSYSPSCTSNPFWKGIDPFSEGRQNDCERFASLDGVSITFKSA